MKRITWALVALCLTITTACGWHLRGSLNLPADLRSIYIQDASPRLMNELSRQLTANGIAVNQASGAEQYTLTIANERQNRRTAALGSDALAAQYEFTASAEFVFRNTTGQILGKPDQVQVSRTVNFDAGQVLGSASESELVQQEMQRDLANQIIRRLSFIAKTAVPSKIPAAPATELQKHQEHNGTPAS